MDYKAAGVDIDAGNETVRRIRGLARSTFTSGVLSDIGSFGGLFQLDRGGSAKLSSWRAQTVWAPTEGRLHDRPARDGGHRPGQSLRQ